MSERVVAAIVALAVVSALAGAAWPREPSASAPALGAAHAFTPSGTDPSFVHGVTLSCQTSGVEWGSDAIQDELDRLRSLGVNWIAYHPYASIRADGTVRARPFDSSAPPPHLVRPIREAHAREISVMVIPHLAYWGSPWNWRGDIRFDDPVARARFFETYTAWLTELARAVRDADAFCIGNEMNGLIGCDAEWRAVIAAVRKETSARLVYGAHWSDYQEVTFWDALDAVGVQAYFPLSEASEPTDAELASAWRAIARELEAVHERTGKPVVLTELGYNCSLDAARTPWTYPVARGEASARAEALQERCLRAALAELEREKDWLRGAFLWKWFIGPAPGENFVLDTERMRAVIRDAWSGR